MNSSRARLNPDHPAGLSGANRLSLVTTGRTLAPEWLDTLPPHDPQAVGSRRDLRKLNRLMRHAQYVAASLRQVRAAEWLNELVELGGGDGTFLLRAIRRWAPPRKTRRAIIVDRVDVVAAETREGFQRLGWDLEVAKADVFDWLRDRPAVPDTGMLANLFLHHFTDEQLRTLFAYAARASRCFVACEPRRGGLPLLAGRLLGILGCNRTTRHDAVVSVRAGFQRGELTRLWDTGAAWELQEQAHLFSLSFRGWARSAARAWQLAKP